MARKDLTNQKFGKLIVLEEYGKDKHGHIIWKCKCECGNITKCLATNLINKKTKSCGCLRKQRVIEENVKRTTVDLSGQKFGKLLVLNKIINNNVPGRNKYKCQCDCGNITYVLPGDLSSGRVQSCGCSLSRGNQLILRELQKSNYIFKNEYKINYNNKIYYFDFAIFDKDNSIKCFIEFDGEQHYKYQNNTTGWNNKEHFKKVQDSDTQKNNYCILKNIRLIRIPYWDIDKITLNFLKERIE